MSIIGDGIMLGAGGESASIFVTGLSENDTVTASKDGKTVIGKWTQIPNPAYVVPDGYTQLEYIESTGTQYIDLNIVPTNHTFEIQYDSGSYNNDEKLFGTEAGYQYYSFTLYSNKYFWGLNGSQTSGGTWSAGKKTLLYNSGSNYGVIQDGVTLGSGSIIAANGQSLCLFKRVSTEGVFFQGLTYYCKLTEKSTNNVVRDCIPVKRLSDNAVGLYDKVENKFYANAGTGEFTAGPEVPQTIDGFLIDKIKSYGTWNISNGDGTKTTDVLIDAAAGFEVTL